MRITITATGIPNAVETLDRRHGPRLNRAVGRAASHALRTIKPAVQAEVPMLTGRARRAVRVARATREARPGAYIGFRKTLPYRGPLVKRTGVIVRAASAHRGTMFSAFHARLRVELNS